MNPNQSIRTKIYLLLSSIALLGICLSFNAESATEFQLIQSLGKHEGGPYAALMKDSAGNFYGTTFYGGSSGAGTVFRLDTSGNINALHEFDGGSGGANPYSGLIHGSDGSLYGTTVSGGNNGAGTMFKLDNSGNFSVLHHFDGGNGGANPYAGLIQGSDGSFYGTTYFGGSTDSGTVFKLDTSGNFSVLHHFDGSSGGANPYAGLILASDGSLYGTTIYGGSSGNSDFTYGTVFKIDVYGNFNIVHSFDGWGGANPYSGLMQGSDGSFYGTTEAGGSIGFGTIFRIDPSGNFNLVHEFAGKAGEGYFPRAGLIQGGDGSFYGTTVYGGSGTYSQGTLFKLDATGNFHLLHSFDATTGANPHAGLIQGNDGGFYGTAYSGGSNGFGSVFKLDPSGKVSVLNSFGDSANIGTFPESEFIQGSDGTIYGTNSGGGIYGYGTVFKLDLSGKVSVLHSFDGLNGAYPDAGLILGHDGSLYGTTSGGGSNKFGTVFKLDPSGNFMVLHDFDGGSGGSEPYAELIQAGDGNFYGTTYSGGRNSLGTIYKLDSSGNFSIVHDFDQIGGWGSFAGLIQGSDGSLYGTTQNGGSAGLGNGTIYKLDEFGNYSVLHSFDGGSGGGSPAAGLIQGGDGSFYGNTYYGGSNGAGTVFKYDATGNFSILHSFDGDIGGAYPYGKLILDNHGSLYGTTLYGGSNLAGSVFRLDPFGNISILHSFDWDAGGRTPYAGLIQASDGGFYGAATYGGQFGGGLIFRLVETSGTTTTLLSSSSNPSILGQAVTFTATVSGNNPGGMVQFLDGTSSLGFGAISNGVATFSTFGLSVGTHGITASYSGDANNSASTSAAVSQVVKAATRTALASSRNQSLAGNSVIFTAIVKGRKPTGTVVFFDGVIRLGESPLSKEGEAKLSTSRLKRGTHRISARYSGDSSNATSTSRVLIQVVR